MSELIPTAATAVSMTGWGLHTLWMRSRLELARRDPLSGLPTRDAFEKAARKMLREQVCALVLIDLDGFKALNDTFGHAAGDAAIRQTGQRLHTCVTRVQRGVVGRLGGDEFAAVLPNPHWDDLPDEMDNVHDWVTDEVEFEDRSLPLGASIGACWTGNLPLPDLALALRRADEAMYAAKQSGGGWHIAHELDPAHETVNGRRVGRDGTQYPEGEAA